MHESFYNKFGSDIMLSNVFKTGLIKLNEQRFSRKTIKEKTLINLEQFQSISKMSEFQPTRKFYFLNVLLENRTLNTGPRQIKLLPLLERRRNKTVISMSGFWATWIQRYQSVAIFFVFLSSIYLQIYRNRYSNISSLPQNIPNECFHSRSNYKWVKVAKMCLSF